MIQVEKSASWVKTRYFQVLFALELLSLWRPLRLQLEPQLFGESVLVKGRIFTLIFVKRLTA